MSQKNVAFLDLVTATPATIYNTGNLSTTLFRFAGISASSLSSANNTGIRLLQLTNKHASGYVAFLPTTADSPSFVASGAAVIAATEGINIGPGASYFLNLKADVHLWLVANVASVPFQVVAYDKVLK